MEISLNRPAVAAGRPVHPEAGLPESPVVFRLGPVLEQRTAPVAPAGIDPVRHTLAERVSVPDASPKPVASPHPGHQAASVALGGRPRDDVDDAGYRIHAPERRAWSPDDLDPVDLIHGKG